MPSTVRHTDLNHPGFVTSLERMERCREKRGSLVHRIRPTSESGRGGWSSNTYRTTILIGVKGHRFDRCEDVGQLRNAADWVAWAETNAGKWPGFSLRLRSTGAQIVWPSWISMECVRTATSACGCSGGRFAEWM